MIGEYPLKIFARAKAYLANSSTIIQGDDYMPP